MTTPMVPSITCPIMVGRADELAVVERHLDGVGPPVLVVSGEAGIGKSRLIAEVTARATSRGVPVLQADCYESERALPYAPLLDLLRAPLAAASEARTVTIDAATAQLAALLPGLSRQAPPAVLPSITEPEQHKRRVFDVLYNLITALAAASPLLIIVEDLHWSDETSLDFLAYLARHLSEVPLRLVLTYRSDESHPTLSHVLAGLERERLVCEVGLLRLTEEQLGAMVQAIFTLHHSPPADIVHQLYRLTDGNPFFIEEVLSSLITLGDLSCADGHWQRKPLQALRVPRTIHDAVQRRTTGLSDVARRVLAVAAVAGQRFDFALLQYLTDQDETALLSIIKELMTRQLLVEESADRFAFRHALTREAVYADLLARERRQIHRAIAEALELPASALPGTPGANAAELADHFYAAGVWNKALTHAQQAGEQSLAVYAPHAAVEHFTRAIRAAEELAIPAPPSLYRGRGRAYEILGDFEPACADYETVRQVARDAGDRQGEWQALIDLGLLWSGRDYTRAGECMHSALEIAREAGDPLFQAHTLNRLGNWYNNVERPREGLQCHQEALAIFEQLQDRRGLAETLDFLGMASSLAVDSVQGAAHYERALPLLEEIDDRQRLVTSLIMWTLQSGFYWYETTAPATLEEDEITRRSERALQLAREMDWPAGIAFVLYERALWLGPRGRYAAALEAAQQALSIAEGIAHQQWVVGSLCTLGALHLDLLDASEAERHLTRALELARELGYPHWVRIATAVLAPAYLLLGNRERAATVLDASLSDSTPMESVGQRLCWRARAQLLLARGEALRALQIVERLIATADPDGQQAVVPGLWKLRGEALAALSRTSEAVQVLHEARDAAATLGVRPILWRIHLSLGKLLHAHGHRTEAREAFAAARAVVEVLTLDIPEGSLRSTFHQRATALLPPLRPPSPQRSARDRFGGLTVRERDVAMRIAEGKSNRAIAAELVVSERTVEGYVGDILAKLACTSRAQVAAWAVTQGLTHRAE